jgi:hypothetical protein
VFGVGEAGERGAGTSSEGLLTARRVEPSLGRCQAGAAVSSFGRRSAEAPAGAERWRGREGEASREVKHHFLRRSHGGDDDGGNDDGGDDD